MDISSDPADNYLLAMAEAAGAHYLVTGDAKGLLHLKKFSRTRILTPATFLRVFKTRAKRSPRASTR